MSNPQGKIFVKPAKAKVLVRNPERQRHLNSLGEWVTKDSYWYKRIQDGDAVELKGDDITAALADIKRDAKAAEAAKAKAAKKAQAATDKPNSEDN